jgi:hypothetical protein
MDSFLILLGVSHEAAEIDVAVVITTGLLVYSKGTP